MTDSSILDPDSSTLSQRSGFLDTPDLEMSREIWSKINLECR